ncbi:hypothetical protein IC575_000534 [Cucumis melo]
MMGLALLPFLLLLSLASTIQGQSIFDVTTYGAKPNTDITQALANAWTEACASTTPSTLLIPKGVYQLSQSNLKGPCKSVPIQVQVEGTLQAPIHTKGDGLVLFTYIDQLILSGSGVFDGQGKSGWEKNNCHKNKICTKLPMVNLTTIYISSNLLPHFIYNLNVTPNKFDFCSLSLIFKCGYGKLKFIGRTLSF